MYVMPYSLLTVHICSHDHPLKCCCVDRRREVTHVFSLKRAGMLKKPFTHNVFLRRRAVELKKRTKKVQIVDSFQNDMSCANCCKRPERNGQIHPSSACLQGKTKVGCKIFEHLQNQRHVFFLKLKFSTRECRVMHEMLQKTPDASATVKRVRLVHLHRKTREKQCSGMQNAFCVNGPQAWSKPGLCSTQIH